MFEKRVRGVHVPCSRIGLSSFVAAGAACGDALSRDFGLAVFFGIEAVREDAAELSLRATESLAWAPAGL